MAFTDLVSQLSLAYQGFLSLIPAFFQTFFNFFFLALMIFLYALFIWKLHNFISEKNILNLDLSRYNTAEHPAVAKIVAVALYFLEYIIILPFLIFFWFSVFGISLAIFTDLEIGSILIISTVIVAAIRITSYASEDTAKELAKLLPLNLLAISLLVPGFFDFERVLNNLNQIPGFLSQIFYYLGFIMALEIILRFFDFLFSIFGSEK
ncbi:MAG: hypothetical protein AABX79_03195 [Nanoarchaeota archaeon]